MLQAYRERVLKTLKWLEETALGPTCITSACFFILIGKICFYNIIAPNLSYPTISICLLINLNLIMHYYYAATVSPGFVDDPPRDSGSSSFLWARKPLANSNTATNLKEEEKTMTPDTTPSKIGVEVTPASTTNCLKCKKTRPERSHHCQKCNRCVLKYDHHCPWINQCVGLYNERHFVLFLIYLFISLVVIIILGYKHFTHAFILTLGVIYKDWDYIIPERWYIQAYTFGIVICLGNAFVLGFTLRGIVYGETAGESHMNEDYRKEAKERDEEFINVYDCGKLKNLQIFFNIQEGGYSLLTLFVPWRTNPYTNGYSWAKKDGFQDYPSFREAKPRETIKMKLYKLFSIHK